MAARNNSLDTIETKIMHVTPDQAKTWLTANTSNRRMSDRTVNAYARDMASAHWQFNGDAIRISQDGTLLDGQHRLAALIKTGLTLPLLVITGLPSGTQETMDTGRKRSVADTLTLRGETNSGILGAVARRVILWDRGDRRFRDTVSVAEVADLLDGPEGDRLRRATEVAVRIRAKFKFLPASSLGTVYLLACRTAPDQVPEFFERIGDGADLETGHPVLVLRNRAISDQGQGVKVGDVRATAYIVRAWNAHRRGENISKIQHPLDAPIPDVL